MANLRTFLMPAQAPLERKEVSNNASSNSNMNINFTINGSSTSNVNVNSDYYSITKKHARPIEDAVASSNDGWDTFAHLAKRVRLQEDHQQQQQSINPLHECANRTITTSAPSSATSSALSMAGTNSATDGQDDDEDDVILRASFVQQQLGQSYLPVLPQSIAFQHQPSSSQKHHLPHPPYNWVDQRYASTLTECSSDDDAADDDTSSSFMKNDDDDNDDSTAEKYHAASTTSSVSMDSRTTSLRKNTSIQNQENKASMQSLLYLPSTNKRRPTVIRRNGGKEQFNMNDDTTYDDNIDNFLSDRISNWSLTKLTKFAPPPPPSSSSSSVSMEPTAAASFQHQQQHAKRRVMRMLLKK